MHEAVEYHWTFPVATTGMLLVKWQTSRDPIKLGLQKGHFYSHQKGVLEVGPLKKATTSLLNQRSIETTLIRWVSQTFDRYIIYQIWLVFHFVFFYKLKMNAERVSISFSHWHSVNICVNFQRSSHLQSH